MLHPAFFFLMIYAFLYCNVDIHHEVIYQEVNFVWIFDEGRNINTISRQWQSNDLKVKRNQMGRGGCEVWCAAGLAWDQLVRCVSAFLTRSNLHIKHHIIILALQLFLTWTEQNLSTVGTLVLDEFSGWKKRFERKQKINQNRKIVFKTILQKDSVLFCFIPKLSYFGYNKPTKND